jgi:4-amino-4-deoxy-L-arabinose transferase-like glycosyltransferase
VDRPRWPAPAVLLALGGGALAVRLLYIVAFARHYVTISDTDHYHTLALAVSHGDGLVHVYPFDFLHPTAFRPPLYPMLLGGLYAAVGRHLVVAQLLNAVLGSAVVVLTAVLATRVAGRRAGLAAGIVAAVYPPLLVNDAVPLTEPLALCLLIATALLLVEQRFVWAGIAAGLLLLTRSSAQLLAVVLVAWLLWRVGWRRTVVFALTLAVVVTPWLVRNWVRLDSPVLTTSNGFNLDSAYSPVAKAAGEWVDPFLDPRLASLRAGITDEVELDNAARREALRSLRADPAQVFPVLGRNVRLLFELSPGDNDEPERLDGRNLSFRWATLPFVWLVTAAGIAGLWRLRRREPIALFAVMVAYFTVACLFTVAVPRLRAPLDVACCIGVGALVAARAPRRRRVDPSPAQATPAPAGTTRS